MNDCSCTGCLQIACWSLERQQRQADRRNEKGMDWKSVDADLGRYWNSDSEKGYTPTSERSERSVPLEQRRDRWHKLYTKATEATIEAEEK